ncbi:MAG: hypothetical protein DLM52_07185 [Chthoniobacterales bacterium]|nr:MAG: hypothetical protein DLM52_07185 [Chthoniobacterales bacterium]
MNYLTIASLLAITAIILVAPALLGATKFHRKIGSGHVLTLLALLWPLVLLSVALFLLRTEQRHVLRWTTLDPTFRLLLLLGGAIVYNVPLACVCYRPAAAAVPFTLHEAALLEGAGIMQRIKSIVLPVAGPTILVGLLTAWIQSIAGLAIAVLGAPNDSPIVASFPARATFNLAEVAIAACVGLSVVALLLQHYTERAAAVPRD